MEGDDKKKRPMKTGAKQILGHGRPASKVVLGSGHSHMAPRNAVET